MTLYVSIFIAIILNIIILVFLRPLERNLSESNNDNNQTDVPQIIFKDFQLFDIGDENILTTTLQGESGSGYKDGRYEISKVKLSYKKYEYQEELTSDSALYNQNGFQLSGNVKYNRSDNSSIECNNIIYDIPNEYAYIPDNFILYWTGKTSEINGKELVVLLNNKEIYAYDIKASFKDADSDFYVDTNDTDILLNDSDLNLSAKNKK